MTPCDTNTLVMCFPLSRLPFLTGLSGGRLLAAGRADYTEGCCIFRRKEQQDRKSLCLVGHSVATKVQVGRCRY